MTLKKKRLLLVLEFEQLKPLCDRRIILSDNCQPSHNTLFSKAWCDELSRIQSFTFQSYSTKVDLPQNFVSKQKRRYTVNYDLKKDLKRVMSFSPYKLSIHAQKDVWGRFTFLT